MGFLKSYLTPGKEKEAEKKGRARKASSSANNNELKNLASGGQTVPFALQGTSAVSATPGLSTLSSPYGSRPASTTSRRTNQYPAGDFRNQDRENLLGVKTDVMCSWLYQQQLERQYATGMLPGEGVVLKKGKRNYACYPPQLRAMPNSLYDMAMELNVRCAMTVSTRVINVILSSRRANYEYIPLLDGLRLQVLPSIRDLPRCQKHHFAAFIQDAQMLIVWDDEPKRVLARAEALEQQLMKMIWGAGAMDENEQENDEKATEKNQVEVGVSVVDLEAALENEVRKTKLGSPLVVAFTLALCIACVGIGVRNVAYEIMTDGNYIRLAFIAIIPLQMWIAMFFFQTIFGNLFQVFGPISAVDTNSKFYSGAPPIRLDRNFHNLPHVTIQMPVYKEGLNGVIRPTIHSLKQAISTYEMQGGSANVFVNDDGMQLISEEDAQLRQEFYEENNIGWVSRPKHNPKPEDGERPFLRRGKFKKASNMNYALMVSNRVEDKLLQVSRTPTWTQADEDNAYQQCLADVIEEHQGRTWAEGNIRMGDYILIIDSDTRVPADCLLDAVSEMEQSPEVAILQFTSGVMRVTSSFFEGGVTWFTNLIYSAITFIVAQGDACPFVGHNAMLRWSAIQDAVAYMDEDGYEKFWSESHVSEDFEISLQLQCAGYILRFASYTGDGFQEGVSLTVYDELARWEKYAYGCNELMFHPFKYWLTRGPFTPLFRKFITTSSIHLPKKITIMAYIGTYYAIGAAWILTLANYFLTGWFYGLLDKFYLDSFAIYVSIIVVFTAFGNVALAILRYRLSQQGLFRALFNNIKWIPLMTIFLGGLQLHVSQALLSHFFSIDMNWGATAKELENVNFVEEVPRLFKRFKGTFLYCAVMTALMVCGAYVFPVMWRITYFASIWPLAINTVSHFLLPVVLNPALMVFAW
ncbi:glycosyl transferase family group 2-domain-containing protein [Xylariales sp. AK1849]|nr:glycosyl transferase family group 2-domain-containing protein [Xylariales sp. AK1849]